MNCASGRGAGAAGCWGALTLPACGGACGSAVDCATPSLASRSSAGLPAESASDCAFCCGSGLPPAPSAGVEEVARAARASVVGRAEAPDDFEDAPALACLTAPRVPESAAVATAGFAGAGAAFGLGVGVAALVSEVVCEVCDPAPADGCGCDAGCPMSEVATASPTCAIAWAVGFASGLAPSLAVGVADVGAFEASAAGVVAVAA